MNPETLLFSLYVVLKYSQTLSCILYCYYTNCKIPPYFSKTIQSPRIPFHDAFRTARNQLISPQYSRFSVRLIELSYFGSERSRKENSFFFGLVLQVIPHIK